MNFHLRSCAFSVLLGVLSSPSSYAGSGECEPAWEATFGASPHFSDGNVHALAVYDDGRGGGPRLHAAGAFTAAGGTSAQRVARLDASGWSPLGSGATWIVHALAVFDDGSGPALYAGGEFVSAGGVSALRIARWDGASWSAVGAGMNDDVRALAVFDDGTGPALFAGGRFTTAGGLPASRIAKWDGTSWTAVGLGVDAAVRAFSVFDDGGGPALYVGGYFSAAGGSAANRIARWDGTSWTALGSGLNHGVLGLAVLDDGGGASLYAGGAFTAAGGVPARHVASWDGASWSALGDGLDGAVNDTVVRALVAFDDGAGDALYACGNFHNTGGVELRGLARWDGAAWGAVGAGLEENGYALQVFDDGTSGPAVYVGGDSLRGGSVTRWDGLRWTLPGASGLDSRVYSSTSFDDGQGLALYAAGSFRFAGGEPVERIAKWDGTGWSGLLEGLDDDALALKAFDDGSGSALFVAGLFTQAGGSQANWIARWNGSAWSSVGSGLDGACGALEVFDDGGGEVLFAAGNFGLARWDGTSWSSLAADPGTHASALAVFDDGGGSALYAAGTLNVPEPAALARWDGAALQRVDGAPNGIESMVEFDDGSGPALYVGGAFLTAEGLPVSNVARWDGQDWSAVGDGLSGSVYALAAFDDGRGAALYAGGSFSVGGVYAIARWNGASWSGVGGGTNGSVRSLAVFENDLVAGGTFDLALDSGDGFIALWRGCPTFTSYCSGDGTATACPCGNVGLPGHGCDLAQGTGGIELAVESFAPDMAGGGTASFVASGYPPASSPGVTLIRNTSAQEPPTTFGDGLLCIGATGVVRLNATLASGGTSLNPVMHGAGAGTFYYQVWVRNTPIMFCDPLAAFNLSNGVELVWP